ncbi:MAG: PAS domain S-box protein [Candidatus Methylacidiphilales bacterium]|nr:PAS domain S-box protein [Candidatus Methylacidiphilales bacterium]
MISPIKPPDEARRLEALWQFDLLDTEPEQAFDDLTALAAHVCEAPVALVTLVDKERQWFKSRQGFSLCQTHRDVSFCGHAILEKQMLLVPDAANDERFADNPLVAGEEHIRFYLGIPLTTHDGHALGALVVMDRVPRQLSQAQIQAMERLARQVMSQLTLRMQTRVLSERERLLRTIFDAEPECVKMINRDGTVCMMNRAGLEIIEADSLEQVSGKCIYPIVADDYRARFVALNERVFRGESGTLQFEIVGFKGRRKWLETHAAPLRNENGDVSGVLAITRDLTARREAEAEASLRKTQLETAMHLVHMGAWHRDFATDRISTFERSSPFAELHGDHYPESGAEYLLRVHPDDRKMVSKALEHSRETGLYRAKFRIVLADGTIRWIEGHGKCERDFEGHPTGLIGVDRDITDQEMADQATRERKELLRLYAEHGPAAIAMLDTDMKYLVVSRRWVETYRLQGLTIIGRSHYNLFPNTPPRWKEIHQRCLHGAVESCDEESFQRSDGSIVWIRWEIRPWHRADGSIGGILFFSEDITERKQADLAIRESESKYRTIIECASDGILISDANSIITDANAESCRMYGYTRDELLGMHVSKLISPSDAERLGPEIARLASGEVIRSEWLCIRKDSSVFPIDVSATLLPDGLLLGMVRDITDRKRSEAALRSSEERFRLFMNNSPTIAWIKNEQGCYVYLSKTFEDYFNVRQEAWEGKTDAEIWPPETAIRIGKSDREVFQAGHALLQTEEVQNAQGSHSWWLNSKFPFSDSAGNRFIAGIGLDITQQKQAEWRIQQLNRVYSVLSDINQTIVREKNQQALLATACRIVVDKGLFCMAWIGLLDSSTGRLRIAAHAGADNETMKLIDLLLADKQRGCVFTMQALRGGEHGVCNDISQHPQAALWKDTALSRGYQSMASLPLTFEGRIMGTFNMYAGTKNFFDDAEMKLLDELAADISFAMEVSKRETERRKAEEELRWRTAFFEAQVESALDGILVVDSQGRRILQNQRFHNLWKIPASLYYSSDEAQLQHVSKSIKNPRQFLEKVAHLSSHPDEISRDEIELVDGTILDRYSSPVRDKAGKHYGRIWTFRDITSQRKLEEQLRQSQKMEAIGQLAGGVAHDFNNILTVIMMQADLAATNPDSSPQTQEMLKEINAASERAANLTRQLLAFSRRQVMQPRLVDLNDIVTSLSKMLRRIVGEDLPMQLNLYSRPLMTRADAGMLDQVLLNLVVNARDAMPSGGNLIIWTGERNVTPEDVAGIPDASPGRYARLSVTDNGMGIPEDKLPHIFEPFFTTKEPGKGTGLGLATVFGIVKQHLGFITVESKVEHGTTVHIYLPAEKSEEPAPAEAKTVFTLQGGKETVLLVEDEAGVRLITRISLERAGYKVLEAPDGVKALKLATEYKEPIHLLITDIVMPEGISGRELASKLQAIKSGLRVIFISGYSAEIAGRELALQEGQNFIQKPFQIGKLLETVRRSLES